MNNINPFNSKSPLFPYRTIIIVTILAILFMVYHDLYGGRVFSGGSQQQWSSSGPGYHK